MAPDDNKAPHTEADAEPPAKKADEVDPEPTGLFSVILPSSAAGNSYACFSIVGGAANINRHGTVVVKATVPSISGQVGEAPILAKLSSYRKPVMH